jgi:hypothetical protein
MQPMTRDGRLVLSMMAGLTIMCGAGRAQELVSPVSRYVGSATAPKDVSGATSWHWVHAGTALQVAGSFGDWATSWKQPEGNGLLAEGSGAYAGRFYRRGTANKVAFSAGLAAVSYAVAWKWPKARRYVGIFNMTVGAGFGAAAISNVIRNPYYKP